MPDITTKVELTPFVAKHYDAILNVASLGIYPIFAKHAIEKAPFRDGDSILDLGSGTGRFACLIKRKVNVAKYVGIDLSEIMIKQALQRCSKSRSFAFIHGEIQKELPFKQEFDKVFISFVLHGFTQENRIAIIQNAYKALKPNGKFIILDYAEKDVSTSPFIIKFLIRKVECPLAEDFINRNLELMLSDVGFSEFQRSFFLGGYVREEIATKK